jgi:GNAT superfamily N-acetyltransferase
MVVNRTLDEIRLVDIALLPAFQNQAIGARLVGDLITEAKEAGRPLRVSVFKPSRAVVFYQRLGFVKSGEAGLYDHWEWTGTAPIKPVG